MKRAVADLQRAFDASFEALPAPEIGTRENILLVKAAGETYAFRCCDMHSLARVEGITALPGSRAGMLGMTGHRGHLVPVFSLAFWLGLPTGGAPSWLALLPVPNEETRVALAFDDIAGQMTVASQAITAGSDGRREFYRPSQGKPVPLVTVSEIMFQLLAQGKQPACPTD